LAPQAHMAILSKVLMWERIVFATSIMSITSFVSHYN
jgi:hypothetical protein